MDRRFIIWTGSYVGVVAALVITSYLTQYTVGPALYLTAGALTLPAGVFIYPALWANALLVGLLVHILRLGAGTEEYVSLVGVVVVFMLAAFGNALLIRELWRARYLFR
jgi:hypothetical protein